MSPTEPVAIDSGRVAELTEREEKRLEQETLKSYEMFKRASKTLVNGVSSTYQARDPYPIYFTHGKGSKIYSVDGHEICDFHNGFGCMVQGHAHPAIVETIKKRSELGTQFALPTEDSYIVAEHLAKNFRLPRWRFVNSGSEATMDAIRIARAYTGRDQIVKIFGSYHGHHDYVMVSLGVKDFGDVGPRDNYKSISYGAGIPQSSIDMTAAVPFNDAPMMEA
ncbi:MAG: aminotransferase class III-fold pyridoxal phosphate-dependent enzyme, partial [Thermoleophilia bacterium]|nr:aminotransferase class III-fold pyridoxal phosphate-dependent enzyme [Thermoleophilia bacterium]